MLAAAMRAYLLRAWRLIAAFGIFGLAVWPVAGWFGYDLIATEIGRLHQGIRISPEVVLGRDYVNVWHGGRLALIHDADVVYDRPLYRLSLFHAFGIGGIYAFSYPPHMLLLSIPFGLPTYLSSLVIWITVTFAIFCIGARPFLKQAGLPIWSVLVLPGAVVNLWAGHFGYLIGGLALIGWWAAQRRPIISGWAFALMSVKPHMGILVPLILAARTRWATIAWATIGVLVMVLLSTLAFGIQAWTTWLTSTLSFQISLIDPGASRAYYFMMPTVNRMVLEFDRGIPVALVQILFGLASCGLIAWAYWRRATLADLGLLSILATPLLVPYLFNYDLVGISLVALIWAARSPARWWSPERLAYGAAFVAAIVQVPLAKQGYWFTPFAILIVLALGAWRAGQHRAELPAS